MRILSLLLSLLSASIVAAADLPKPSGDTIVSPDAKLELLFTRTAPIHGGLTEGPAAAPDGSIYFSDIPFGKDKGMILRFDPKTKKTDGLHRRQPQIERPEIRRQGLPDRLRGFRRGRPLRFALGRQKPQANRDRRSLPGQTLQRAERSRHRSPRPHLLHRSALSGNRAARTGASRRLSHRPRRQGERGDARPGEAQRHRPQPGRSTLYVADHNNGTDRIDPSAPPPKHGAMKIYAFRLGTDGLRQGIGKGADRFRHRDAAATA